MLREARFCDFGNCQRLAAHTCPLCEKDGCPDVHLTGDLQLDLRAALTNKNEGHVFTRCTLLVCKACYLAAQQIVHGTDNDNSTLAREFMPTVVTALRALLTKETLKEPT